MHNLPFLLTDLKWKMLSEYLNGTDSEFELKYVSDTALAFLVDEVLALGEVAVVPLGLIDRLPLWHSHILTIDLHRHVLFGVWRGKKKNYQ